MIPRVRRAGRCQCGGRAAASGEPRRDPVRRRTVGPSPGHGIHAAHRRGAPAHGRHARRLGKTGTARRNHQIGDLSQGPASAGLR